MGLVRAERTNAALSCAAQPLEAHNNLEKYPDFNHLHHNMLQHHQVRGRFALHFIVNSVQKDIGTLNDTTQLPCAPPSEGSFKCEAVYGNYTAQVRSPTGLMTLLWTVFGSDGTATIMIIYFVIDMLLWPQCLSLIFQALFSPLSRHPRSIKIASTIFKCVVSLCTITTALNTATATATVTTTATTAATAT